MYHYYYLNGYGSARELDFREAAKLAHDAVKSPVAVYSDFHRYGDTTIYDLYDAVYDETFASGYKGFAREQNGKTTITGVDLSWFIPVTAIEVEKPLDA